MGHSDMSGLWWCEPMESILNDDPEVSTTLPMYWTERRQRADWSIDWGRDSVIAIIAAVLMRMMWHQNLWEDIWLPLLAFLGAVFIFEVVPFLLRFLISVPK